MNMGADKAVQIIKYVICDDMRIMSQSAGRYFSEINGCKFCTNSAQSHCCLCYRKVKDQFLQNGLFSTKVYFMTFKILFTSCTLKKLLQMHYICQGKKTWAATCATTSV
jgi:hypothetical protein